MNSQTVASLFGPPCSSSLTLLKWSSDGHVVRSTYDQTQTINIIKAIA